MKNRISVSQEDALLAQFTAAALTGLLCDYTLGRMDDGVIDKLAGCASQMGMATTRRYLEDNGIKVIPNVPEAP